MLRDQLTEVDILVTFLSLGTYLCVFWCIFVFRKITKGQPDNATDDVLRYARIFFGEACELISQIQFKDAYNNLSFSKLG